MPVNALDVIRYVGHFAGALPLATFGVLAAIALARKRAGPGPEAWQIATAFFVSFVVDSIALEMLNAGMNNHMLMYIGAPLQFGLLVLAFRPEHFARAVGLMLVLTVISTLDAASLASPEALVATAAGAWVGWLAYRSDSPYRWPVMIYCAAAVPLIVMATTTPATTGPWIVAWIAYQAMRVSALVLMSAVLLFPGLMEAARDHVGRARATGGTGPVARRARAAADRERRAVRA